MGTDETTTTRDDAPRDRLSRRALLRLGALASAGALLALAACGEEGGGEGEDEDEDEDDD